MSDPFPQLTWPTRRSDAALALAPTAFRAHCEGACGAMDAGPFGAAHALLEADNLEGLKWAMARAGNQRPELILIDPPYNTDKRFFYRDRQGQAARTRGERRAAWLGFMLPRLMLAQQWLSETGVILVHIDEHEAHYLQVLMTEVFGAENDLGEIVWDKRNPKGDASGIAVQHETLLVFAKNKTALKADREFERIKPAAQGFVDKAAALMRRVGKSYVPSDLKQAVEKYALDIDLSAFARPYTLEDARAEFLEWTQAQPVPAGLKAYRFLDEAGQVYRAVSMAWPNKKQAPAEYFEPLRHPKTGEPCPVPARGWRNPPDTMARLLKEGKVLFGADARKQPERKYLLQENMRENFASILYYGGSDDALLKNLGIPFDTPKPVELTKQLILAFAAKGGLIVDFFAGSGTVGHAAMVLSAAGLPVQSLCIQSPEVLEEGPATLAARKFCASHGLAPTVFSLTRARLEAAARQTQQALAVWRA